MSLVYEDENKIVSVALAENDYVKILTLNEPKKVMIIKNVNGVLIATNEDKKEEKGK